MSSNSHSDWIKQIDDLEEEENDAVVLFPGAKKQRNWKKIGLIASAVLFAIVVLSVIVITATGGGGDHNNHIMDTTSATTTSTSATPSMATTAMMGTEAPIPLTDYDARARRVLRHAPLFDTHNDLMFEMQAYPNLDLTKNHAADTTLNTDFARAEQGGLRGQFWSVAAPCSPTFDPVEFALEQIDAVKRFAEHYSTKTTFVTTYQQALNAIAAGKLASFIGVEGGHMINNSLEILRQLYELGARYMTITHFCNTGWAESSANDNLSPPNRELGLNSTARIPPYVDVYGLTDFGKEVIREMNRLGMIVDLSHVSEKTMHDALDVSVAPVIFSHSNARAVFDHTRNVPDAVLMHLKQNGGVVHVNFYCPYLSEASVRLYSEINYALTTRDNDANSTTVDTDDDEDRTTRSMFLKRIDEANCSVSTVADHIMYIVNKIGVDHVGIGSDFDGVGGILPKGLQDVSQYPNLIAELLRRGMSDGDAMKIVGQNLLRVLKKVEEVAAELQKVVPPSHMQYNGTYDQLHTARSGAHGGVAADSPVCSDVGARILRQGGHAVDSAVAVALCLGVVHPMSSGIGGGGFIVVYEQATGRATTIDFREMAPQAVYDRIYVDKGWSSLKGSKAFGVPGEIRGLHQAHSMFGRLPWADVVEPALRLATDGFVVDKLLARALAGSKYSGPEYDAFWKQYAPNGVTAVEGQLLRNLPLARTLRAVQQYGAYGFYDGPIAEDLIGDIAALGGILTADDLRSYYAIVSDAQKSTFRNSTVFGAHLPAAGGALLAVMLNIIETFPQPATPRQPPSALDVHRMVEAMKFAFADRGLLGDPKFANLTGVYPEIISKAHAAACRAALDDSRTFPYTHYNVTAASVDDSGTSHLSVMDDRGNAVGLTTTVNMYFGSAVLSPRTGILLNDQMDDFSVDPNKPNGFGLAPNAANFVAPRKRPMSSMTPTVVLYPNSTIAWFTLGGSGGPTIITSVLQVLLGVVDRRESLRAALDRPRLHHQLLPDVVQTEPEYDAAIVDALRARNHTTNTMPGRLGDGQVLGVVQIVMRDKTNGKFAAASDIRKGGVADAFKK